MTRRRMIIIMVLVLAGTVVLEAEVVVRRLVVQRSEEILGDCVQLENPAVDLGGRPVVLRAIRGHLDDISFTAESAELAGIRLADLRGRVASVRFSVFGGIDGAYIDRAHVSVQLDERDVERVLRDLGVPGTVSIDFDGINVRLDDPSTAIRLRADVDKGAAVIALDGALARLLRLRFEISGVTVTTIEASAGTLRVDAMFNGSPRDVACAAEGVLASQIGSLSRLSTLLRHA